MLTSNQAAIAKGLQARGEKQHDIAAYFGENSGRIADIVAGRKHPDVEATSPRALPSHDIIVQGGHDALVRAHQAVRDAAAALADANRELEQALQASQARARGTARGPNKPRAAQPSERRHTKRGEPAPRVSPSMA